MDQLPAFMRPTLERHNQNVVFALWNDLGLEHRTLDINVLAPRLRSVEGIEFVVVLTVGRETKALDRINAVVRS